MTDIALNHGATIDKNNSNIKERRKKMILIIAKK